MRSILSLVVTLSLVAPALSSQDTAEETAWLALPSDTSQPFTVELSFEGSPRMIQLSSHDLRAGIYSAEIVGGRDHRETVVAPAPCTLRGTTARAETVAASLRGHGLQALVLETNGGSWVIESLGGIEDSEGRLKHRMYRPADPFAGAACGTDLLASLPPDAPSIGVPREQAGSCLDLAEIAFDVNYEYFAISGDIGTVLADVDAYLNAVAAIHIRDLAVDYSLTHVVVRTTQGAPYTSDVPGELLNAFRTEWNGNQGGVQRDMAHLLVGQEMTGNIIGLAWVGQVCNGFSYGLTQGNLSFGGIVSVLSHELGHNWNAPHCLDPSPCNQMCGGCNVFGPNSVQRIRDYVATRTCLDSAPPASDPFPPYASPDQGVGFGPTTIDVLANDHDANCDSLSIDGFEATSAMGGTIILSSGTGPDGRDELLYTPPGAHYQGSDSFDYVVGDGQGAQASATVEVFQRDSAGSLALHLRMDEAAGVGMLDSSVFQKYGEWRGDPQLGQAGVVDQAVRFDGIGDRGRQINDSSYVDVLRENLSVCAWVRPESDVDWQRFYGNTNSWSFGMRDGNLVFTTFGIRDYQPGSISRLAQNQWQHVAAVMDADHDVRFYIDGVFVAEVNGDQAARAAGGAWYVGSRNDDTQFFTGSMDDLQVYDTPLSDSEVQFLASNPGATLGLSCGTEIFCSTSPNSAGPGGRMASLGSTAVSANDLVIFATNVPVGTFGLFFYGPSPGAMPLGDGVLCVTGGIVRLPVVQVDDFGRGLWDLDLTAPPQPAGEIVVGTEWHFQFWYRDPAFGGAGFNFSDGLKVTFCP